MLNTLGVVKNTEKRSVFACTENTLKKRFKICIKINLIKTYKSALSGTRTRDHPIETPKYQPTNHLTSKESSNDVVTGQLLLYKGTLDSLRPPWPVKTREIRAVFASSKKTENTFLTALRGLIHYCNSAADLSRDKPTNK